MKVISVKDWMNAQTPEEIRDLLARSEVDIQIPPKEDRKERKGVTRDMIVRLAEELKETSCSHRSHEIKIYLGQLVFETARFRRMFNSLKDYADILKECESYYSTNGGTIKTPNIDFLERNGSNQPSNKFEGFLISNSKER